MRTLRVTVTPEQTGRRVDSLLRRELGLSGSMVKRVKRLPGGLLLDGAAIYTSYRVRAGQTLDVLVGDLENGVTAPRPGPLDIVYEDGDVAVLNKAPLVPTHPGPTNFYGTVGNFFTYHVNEQGDPHVFRPVNRLDAHTSGLMVVAKHAPAHELLKTQLHTPDFRREYLAVCLGTPEPGEGVIDVPLGPAEDSYLARQATPDGQEARTRYRVLDSRDGLSLVALELDTGRTHQIRVHMAHIGHPLAGDFLYGSEDKGLIGRTALHSHRVEFLQPITGERLRFEAPLPPDMQALFPG